MKHLSIVIFLLLLSGCVTEEGPIFQTAPEPKASDALIYIYRPDNSAFALTKSHFYVDDVKVANLYSGRYTWFHVPAGEYLLKQKWPMSVDMGFQTIIERTTWLPNKTYYYRLATTGKFLLVAAIVRWQFMGVSAGEAIPEITDCKLQPAFDIQKALDQHKR